MNNENKLGTTLGDYNQDGVACLEGLFSQQEIEDIIVATHTYLHSDYEGISLEADKKTVRGAHGMHLYNDFFKSLVESDKLLNIAKELLGEDIYVHQSKINVKKAAVGASWPWHQDFVFWHKQDHIEKDELVNIAILLDDVDHLSGPLWFVPKTHKIGNVCEPIAKKKSASGDWKSDISEALSYQVPQASMSEFIDVNGCIPALGKKGDVIVFHPQVIHGSPNNLSPNDRKLLIFTFNKLNNQSVVKSERPEFLCSPAQA